MRIGFDATVLAPATRYSGTGHYTLKLLSHLTGLDDGNEYVAYGPSGCPRPAELPDSVKWHVLPRWRALGKLSAVAVHLLALPRLAAAHRLDLMHAPTVQPRLSRPPVPQRLPCPLVVTLHDLIPVTHYGLKSFHWRWRLFYEWNLRSLRRSAQVITVSEASRREILALLQLDPARVVTVYNGVEEPAVLSSKAPAEEMGLPRPYALCVGSYEPRKNLLRLLQAYAQAVASGLPHHLVIVAQPDDSGRDAVVQDLVRELGLQGRVRFLHGLPEPSLWRVYCQADLFVFPSLAEGFGLPPLEAMAAGVPVIASGLPSLREVLGNAAWYVDPMAETEIATALLHLAGDADLRAQLAESGRRQAARYPWAECARRTLEVYSTAVRSPQIAPLVSKVRET